MSDVVGIAVSKSKEPVGQAQNSLKRGILWTFVGNAIYFACQWAMIVVLAKMTNVLFVGEFTYGLAITTPLVLLTNMSLSSFLATHGTVHYDFRDCLGIRLISLTVVLMAMIGFCLLARFPAERIALIACILMAKIFDSLSELIYSMLQKHERLDRVSLSKSSQGILQLITLVSILSAGYHPVYAVLGMAIVSGVITLCFNLPSAAQVLTGANWTRLVFERSEQNRLLWKEFLPRWNSEQVKIIVRSGLPLGFVAILSVFNINISRYFLEHYRSVSAVGIFSVHFSLAFSPGLFTGAVGPATMTRLSQHFTANIRAFRKLAVILMVFSFVCGILTLGIGWLAGEPVLRLLYGAIYAKQMLPFYLLSIAAAVMMLTAGLTSILISMRAFRSQLPVMSAALLVNLIMCMGLVPKYGEIGAAISLIAGYLCSSLCFALIVVRCVRKVGT